jgi:hypothetical protein
MLPVEIPVIFLTTNQNRSLVVDCFQFEEFSFAQLIVQSEFIGQKVEYPEVIQNAILAEISGKFFVGANE